MSESEEEQAIARLWAAVSGMPLEVLWNIVQYAEGVAVWVRAIQTAEYMAQQPHQRRDDGNDILRYEDLVGFVEQIGLPVGRATHLWGAVMKRKTLTHEERRKIRSMTISLSDLWERYNHPPFGMSSDDREL